MPVQLASKAFEPGGDIPLRYTKDGDDLSPPLEWDEVPEQTRELALLLVDRSRDPRPFAHWIIYGIPPEQRSLPEGAAGHRARTRNGELKQGRNDLENIGYDGPEPPLGPAHEYHFRLLALDAPLDAEPGLPRDELERQVEGHVLDEAELVGHYARPG